MRIRKVIVKNYKALRQVTLDLNPDINILVGKNECGKSTLLEAINLALTFQVNGRNIQYELSPYLFNGAAVDEFLNQLRSGSNPPLPSILVELYFENDPGLAKLKGSMNSLHEDTPGLKVEIAFNLDFREDYDHYIKGDRNHVCAIPTEFYSATWRNFNDNNVSARSIPIGSTLIDATSIRLQTGADYYLQKLINDDLDPRERAHLSLTFRGLKEKFAKEPGIKTINDRLKDSRGAISDRELSVSIDLSQKTNWDATLTSFVEDIPFHHAGKGEQNTRKILLALDRKAHLTNVVLIEEPENHLAFSSMHSLMSQMQEKCADKQLIITTHSAFVLNKLGIEHLILLAEICQPTRITQLKPDTIDYFRKLAGYDTLRLVLAKRSFLVEGPSDELFIQKAYLMIHGKLPIQDGIDVISVRGLSFVRFLEIASRLDRPVTVFTDNDGDYATKVEKKYSDYSGLPNISIASSRDDALHTLEPNIVACNDLATLNDILGLEGPKRRTDKESILDLMLKFKTEAALRIFSTEKAFRIPSYIYDALQ